MRRILIMRQRFDGDAGNTMIIAMAVLMIMGILAASVWAKTLSGIHLSQRDQGHFQTMAVANSGIDVAMFRIEQIDPGDSAAPTVLTGSGSFNGGTYTYEATRRNTINWEITALAVSGDGTQHRAIRVDSDTMPKLAVAVGGKTSVDFNGNPALAGLCAYTSASSSPDFDTECVNGAGGTAVLDKPLVGTSGSLACTGSGWADVPAIGWPTAGSNPSSSGCDNFTISTQPYPWDPFPVPGNALPCPDNGVITALTISQGKLTPGGRYKCTNLTLGTGDDMNLCLDPLQFTQANDVEFYITGDLHFGKGVAINVGRGTNANHTANDGTKCPGAPKGTAIETTANDWYYPTAQPGAFRVYGSGTGSIIPDGNGSGAANVAMVVYAPDMDYADIGGGPHIVMFGSLMVNEYRANGQIRCVAYDNSLSTITTKKYVLVNWREIVPPAQV